MIFKQTRDPSTGLNTLYFNLQSGSLFLDFWIGLFVISIWYAISWIKGRIGPPETIEMEYTETRYRKEGTENETK